MTTMTATRPTARTHARKPGRLSVRVLSPGCVRITVGARSTDYRIGALPTAGRADRRELWLEKTGSLAVFIVGLSDDGTRDYCDCGRGYESGRCCHVSALQKLLDRGRLADPMVRPVLPGGSARPAAGPAPTFAR